MSAKDDLQRLETATDWDELIDLALGDPPNPAPLAGAFKRWWWVFSVVYDGDPMPADFPPGIDEFFRKLAFADYPPDVLDWCDVFRSKNERWPKESELPRALRKMLPKGTRGRPRCDTQRMRAAARAWATEVLRDSYQSRLSTIKDLGKTGILQSCFGFDQVTMQGDSSSGLALAKLSEDTKISEDRLHAILYPNRRKRVKK